MYRLYDFLLILAAIPLLPYALFKGIRHGNARRGVAERLALYDSRQLGKLKNRQVIWVHAVSVGETRASIPLLRKLRKTYPEAAIVLSSLTFTGRAIADEIEEVDFRIFLPYDFSLVVRRAIQRVQPDVVLLVETELWPNFIKELSRKNIPIILVNGRISDRSFPRYWLVKSLLRPLLQKVTLYCMQSRQDQLRILRLGADSEKTVVTGNLKFDLPAPGFSEEEVGNFRKILRLPDDIPVWVAGSTRQGEEELVLDAFDTLLREGMKLVLVIVPRYPERAAAIGDLLEKREFSYELRSGIEKRKHPLVSGEVLVGDSLGEMLMFYACADVVFVGGSLVPIGGHNVLEASLLCKPVIFGPHMQNFRSISNLLLESGGGMQAEMNSLADKVGLLLREPGKRMEMGSRGEELFAEHCGATERTVATVRRVLESP